MRIIGGIIYAFGGVALILIDVVSSFWLAAMHGIGWVILAWITVLPLLVLPFFAGFGPIYAVALVVTLIGAAMWGN